MESVQEAHGRHHDRWGPAAGRLGFGKRQKLEFKQVNSWKVTGQGGAHEPCCGDVMMTRWVWLLSQKQVWKNTRHITYFKHKTVSLEQRIHSCKGGTRQKKKKKQYSAPVELLHDVLWQKRELLFWKSSPEPPLLTACNFIAPEGHRVLGDLQKDGGKVDVHGCVSVAGTSAKAWPHFKTRARGKYSLNDALQAVSAKDQSSGSQLSGKMGWLSSRQGAPKFDRCDVERGPQHLDRCTRAHLSVEKEAAERSPACARERWDFLNFITAVRFAVTVA